MSSKYAYAKVYDPFTKKLAQDMERDDLVCGPETARRMEQNMSKDIAVTVVCITYGHEQYIAQALEGFVKQKTTFRYQVYVGDDCSQDRTPDIVREYAEKYPNIIVPFCRKKNLGAQRNLIELCQQAISPYIAFCEGDDYWIDENKLQQQFDYMQSNPKIRLCHTRTRILAPSDWHLNNYYKRSEKNEIIVPDGEPGYQEKDYWTVADFAAQFPSHTSNVFYRWNYDLIIPEWFYTGLIGDTPIELLQLGSGRAVYLPGVTSVYRRSDVGVFMNHSNQEHFLNTRLDYLRLLLGLEQYFEQNYQGLYLSALRSRACKEMINYFNAAKNRPDLLRELVMQYPEYSVYVIQWFRKQQTSQSLPTSYQNILRQNTDIRRATILFIRITNKIKTIKEKIKRKVGNGIKKAAKLLGYWGFALVPKRKERWVITSFRHRGYMDNSKYFYEYVVKHHPEIQIAWVTTDDKVYEALSKHDMPVEKMNSFRGIKAIARASIAITDHFVMSDYSPMWGFNARTKVVQLWHGVGFKSMGDGKNVSNTKEPGVVYSYDILPQTNDSIWTRMAKKLLYIWRAPFRELFENYFMLVCPGEERKIAIGRMWNMPESTFFMAGHPRDINLYNTAPIVANERKILYAPTYRFDVLHEKQLILDLLHNADCIQEQMEKSNCEFYLRMHPHTWRNYDSLINSLINKYSRIKVDKSADIYTNLHHYTLVITDYSSIGMDAANIGKPVIFHCPDYEWFIAHEAGFGLDFKLHIPGVMTSMWPETIRELSDQLQNPNRNASIRKKRISYFFDRKANGPGNSERICEELKRRLRIN